MMLSDVWRLSTSDDGCRVHGA